MFFLWPLFSSIIQKIWQGMAVTEPEGQKEQQKDKNQILKNH